MQDSVQEWIETAAFHPDVLGSFLYAVLSNDLIGALACADSENLRSLREWGMFLYNDAPSGCYGSREKLLKWYAHGGASGVLRGLEATP